MTILDAVFVYRLAHGEKLAYHGRYHMHGDGEFEIHLFLNGEGTFLSNKKRLPICENSLLLCAPHEFHSILPERVTRPITYYAILFKPDKENDTEIYQLLTDFLLYRTVLQVENANRFLFEELLHLWNAENEGCRKSAACLLSSFLYRWYYTDTKKKLPHNTAISASDSATVRFQKAVKLLEESVRQNITVQELAFKLGFSAEHFIRMFRDHMHMTPYQYLIRLKAEAASASLISGTEPVGRISSELGFENQFHFSRVFKKCTGMTPTAYRKCFSRQD